MITMEKQGIARFAKPEHVLYHRASATITSYLGEEDASGNEIGVIESTG